MSAPGKSKFEGFSSVGDVADYISSSGSEERAKAAEIFVEHIVETVHSPTFLTEMVDFWDKVNQPEAQPNFDPFSENSYWYMQSKLLRKLDRTEELTDTDRQWLKMKLLGKYDSVKSAKSGSSIGSSSRWTVIIVEYLSEHGFSVFRNETTAPISALDIVASVNQIVGEGPSSYSGVKALYLHGRNKSRWTA